MEPKRNHADRSDFLENLISQFFQNREVRFSRFFHQRLSTGVTNVNIQHEGARCYLIHAWSLSDNTAGVGAILINNENIFNYFVTPNLADTHNFLHFHDGIEMRITKPAKLEGTVHYQYISFASNDK